YHNLLHCVVLVSSLLSLSLFFFFFIDTPPTEIYTLSLHDALPISYYSAMFESGIPLDTNPDFRKAGDRAFAVLRTACESLIATRSEEHTSELQSRFDLVCRLLLEKKKQGRTRR